MRPAALLLCFVFTVSAHAQRGGAALFSRYPFDAWAAESAKPGIRWNVDLESAHLTPHQRLSASIHVRVDDSELKRQSGGRIIAFLRIEDASGGRYQTANSASLQPLNSYGELTRISHKD